MVGKNGTGKTTLVRAIKNLLSADTFSKTASPYIFNNESQIDYHIDGKDYSYKYDSKLKAMDTKDSVPLDIRNSIKVELPIPYGIRFNQFQKLGKIDSELRGKITLKEYNSPDELIAFLGAVYSDNRFSMLKEVTIKKDSCYFILEEDNYYIREDYLSSGEYFLIHLYKLIQEDLRLIVIDEIDISLDASAQVNLVKELRRICNEKKIRIVFTTHSLALMKTLKKDELQYLDELDGRVTVEPTSYNYVKSFLFGFKGWDKYILTEDIVLEAYINYLIKTLQGEPSLCKFKIIPVGGGANVVKLMEKNDDEEFLSMSDNVICVLDGDQRNEPYAQGKKQVLFTPFNNIEDKFQELVHDRKIRINLRGRDSKKLYEKAIEKGACTEREIFEKVSNADSDQIDALKKQLLEFLSM